MKRKKRILKLLLVLIVAGAGAYFYLVSPRGETQVNYEPSEKTCFEEETPVTWRACIYSAKQGTTDNVAYLLHGRGRSEHEWNEGDYYTGQIQKVWQTLGVKPPKIVAISFGPFWLLGPKNSAPQSGLLEVFTDHIIPEVEKRTGIPKKRIVFGESMGGINTLILALSAGNLFSRALSMCPPLYKMSPFSSFQEIKEFLARTGADPRTIFGIKAVAHLFATNEVEWNQISPIKLLEKADPSTTPPLYLSCGLYDKYGNYEAAEYFAETAKARGFKIDWRPLYGGHCVVDVNSVASFISNEN